MCDTEVEVKESIEYWETRWSEQKTGWHQNVVDSSLTTFYNKVTGKDLPGNGDLPEQDLKFSPDSVEFQENSKKQWFVPLCGKTMDIPFLLGLGYKVFGVEGVKLAIETLGTENNLSLTFNEENSVYTGAEGRLRIFYGDLFKCPFSLFGDMDYIWDRGSLIAFEYPMRTKYIEAMQQALKKPDGKYHNFTYLLDVVEYDKTKFAGPPRSVSDDDLKLLYEDWSTVECLRTAPIRQGSTLSKMQDLGDAFNRVHIIKPRN